MYYRSIPIFTALSVLTSALLCSTAFSMGKPAPQPSLEQRCPDILSASRNPDSELARKLQFNSEELLKCQLHESEQRRREDKAKHEEENRMRQEAEKALREYQAWARKNIENWQQSRCDTFGDSVGQGAEAQGRVEWAKKCVLEKIDELATKFDVATTAKSQLLNVQMITLNQIGNMVGPTGRVYYPTFGLPDYKNGSSPTNPRQYRAPTDPNAPCNLPDDYLIVGYCTAGCFTPDQNLLYADGYHPIATAYSSSLQSIVTLRPDSTLEDPTYQVSELDGYTLDLVEGDHAIIDLKTLTGKTLSITENHPLLVATGEMIQAGQLKKGDLLVQANGSFDPITELSGRNFFGRVYNVRVRSSDLRENVVVAQGLLSGTAYYQNEGIKDLNRSLFRFQLTDPFTNE